MKSKVSIFIIVCFFSALLVFAALKSFSSDSKNASEYIQPNEGVVSFKDFYVSSNSTNLNTFARGTIFVEKDESDNYTAQIVAWIDIDPMDWGGISFTLPFGWEVAKITCSYPDTSANIVTWESSNDDFDKWHQIVEIATSHVESPSGGGSGSIVIELATSPKGQEPSKALEIMVGVGSDGNASTYYGLWPDFETVEVPIIQYD
jgi:hypothetical protein